LVKTTNLLVVLTNLFLQCGNSRYELFKENETQISVVIFRLYFRVIVKPNFGLVK
jgi:hypothetical protein